MSDLGVVQGVLEGVVLGGPSGVDEQLDIDRKALLHGPLFGRNADCGHAIDFRNQDLVHHLSLSSSGSRPANPASTSCQYPIASSPRCQHRYTIRPPLMYGKSHRPLSTSFRTTPM